MANFNLEDYEPVEERIKRFYSDHKEGRILTDIHTDNGKSIIVKASIHKDASDVVWATGYAEEVRGEGFVNKTSAVENCETSAIGRALANANYAGSKRPSREEMAKTQRPKNEPLSSEQVTKLVSLAKMKGLTSKEAAVTWLNKVLDTPDFTKLASTDFDSYVKIISNPKLRADSDAPF